MRFKKSNCRKKMVFSQPDVPTLCVRAGFRSTKLSTYHKSPIGKLNLNGSTLPRMTQNVCVCPAYAGHTPKAFQIVQKYKFSFTNQVFGVLFFQRV